MLARPKEKRRMFGFMAINPPRESVQVLSGLPKEGTVAEIIERYGASQRQACAVLSITRSVYGYCSRARDARPLVARIKEIATTRVHYGYRRVHVLLRREGWKDNHML
jgi:putative transposase